MTQGPSEEETEITVEGVIRDAAKYTADLSDDDEDEQCEGE